MSLSEPIMGVFGAFASAVSQPTWRKIPVRSIGTLIARGRRTVTAALRQLGWRDASHFSLYPHGLNRARWSALEVSRRLRVRLVRSVVIVGGERPVVIDETWERRWGRRINTRGHDRDPLASSPQRSVATRGWRWIVRTLVITPPWTQGRKEAQTPWPRVRVRWDNGRRRALAVTRATAVW